MDQTQNTPCLPFDLCDLDLGGRGLGVCMTCRLSMVNNCAKLFENPLMNAKVMDRTGKIPYNRP